MNIGEAAAAAGVSAKMIRHWEAIGLLPAPIRTESNYRVYRDRDLDTLTFVRRARDLGFPIEEIRRLLGLWRDGNRASATVKAMALEQVDELDRRIAELQAMKARLQALAAACPGDAGPKCTILAGLEGAGEGVVPEHPNA